MRAIAVNEYGAMPALMEVPDPQPGPGQLLIKVEAAGINPMDRMIADGALQPIGPARFPLVLGVDLAGMVETMCARLLVHRVVRPATQEVKTPAGVQTYRPVEPLPSLDANAEGLELGDESGFHEAHEFVGVRHGGGVALAPVNDRAGDGVKDRLRFLRTFWHLNCTDIVVAVSLRS
jgi:hypothetical protein